MFEKFKFWLIIIMALLLLAYLLPTRNVVSYIAAFYEKSDSKVNLSLVNPEVKVLSADPSNKLVIRAEVKNASGIPVSKAHLIFSVSNNIGEIYPNDAKTDKYGECLVTYIPPAYNADEFKAGDIKVNLTAGLYKSSLSSTVNIALTRTPLIYVHGYQANGDIFENLKDYLSAKNFEGSAINYKSQNGVVASAKELDSFLDQQKSLYLSKGIQVQKFDIIAHSMGGLVARYYTCSPDYINKDNVRKIIFVSVPQTGSHWASLGTAYFNDQGIKDLIPDNPLFTEVFPSLLNKGLNSTIQVGNILGQYDEVVSPESASLEEWNIKTDLFDIGENNFTVDNLLNGSIIDAANHKNILNNKKVFETIEQMLNTNLPYPVVRLQ